MNIKDVYLEQTIKPTPQIQYLGCDKGVLYEYLGLEITNPSGNGW